MATLLHVDAKEERLELDQLKERLEERLAEFDQQHVLRFWDELDDAARRRLVDQLNAIDLEQLDRLGGAKQTSEDWADLARRAAGPPAIQRGAADNPFTPDQAKQRGAEAVRAGQLGVILVAGGQGTRLGFELPKGMYPIGPVSKASLFQILIEKVVALAKRHGVRVPLYLMTSPATHSQTIQFLDANERFGLQEDDLFVFQQGTMPAVDAETGRLLLAEQGNLALSPDGHGGTLAALTESGALEDIGRRGIESLFYLQIDNVLTALGDAEFLGYHLLGNSEMSTLVVRKTRPEEKVGNVVQVDGQVRIIEYSDLPPEAASRRSDNGTLELWAGNTAVHLFDTAFLECSADSPDRLPFHVARKQVPYIDADGQRIVPDEPNAIKFERFVFDLLPAAARTMVVEIDPNRQFAPLKNGSGADHDSPETVRAQMVALAREWLQAAGASVDNGVLVEISPLYSLDGAELIEKIEPGLRVSKDRYFR